MKVPHIASAFLLLVLLCQSGSIGDGKPMEERSTEITKETSKAELLKEEPMTTEIATVQELRDGNIILQNNVGETYVIPDASRFKLFIEENQEMVFSYTEKILSEDGRYVLTVKWLDNWSGFDQSKFVHGA